MVYNIVTQRESKDHQRCLPACAGATDEDVQFPRVQRLEKLLLELVRMCAADTLCLDSKIVYRRYASLFFIAGCASTDNELITLEIVHRYVEQMDKYYGNVCELDIIFNFQKAYFILDELLLAGEMQESSKKNVLRVISAQDQIEDTEVSSNLSLDFSRVAGFVWSSSLSGTISSSWEVERISHVLTYTTLISDRRRSHQNHVK